VVLDGGELLISWNAEGRVTMRGPAETAFVGALEEWV
jgi:diaminopimelate epimerase